MQSDQPSHIPILKMGEFLLVSIQIDLDDRVAVRLQEDLLEKIRKTGATGVLLDISSLQVVDSFLGRMIGNIASMASILDAEVVVVGMRHMVAITLVELGVTLKGIRSAPNLEKGTEILRSTRRARKEGIYDLDKEE